VTPCFNEQENIEICYRTVQDIFAGELAEYDYEHVFCDNNSADCTPEILEKLAADDPRVKVIFNARNFGAFASLFNGLRSTSGDAVVVCLPADLQDPPELIPQFVRLWEQGNDIVYGVRKERQERRLLAVMRRLYYKLIGGLSSIDLPNDAGEFQLVDRRVADILSQFNDQAPFLRGMIASCGFRKTGVEYVMKSRDKGRSKSNFYTLIDIGLIGLTSTTNFPLRLIMFIGFAIAVVSLIIAVVSVALGLIFFRSLAPAGIPTIITALFFFSGLNLFLLGLLGEYVAAIHNQVLARPLVIERRRINFDLPKDQECS
jgi:glycosyltransferase involved in cell wall biosynthesis